MVRLFLSAKDIMGIIGKGKTAASALCAKIKERFRIPKYQQISVEQFCAFTGLRLELVLAQLRK